MDLTPVLEWAVNQGPGYLAAFALAFYSWQKEKELRELRERMYSTSLDAATKLFEAIATVREAIAHIHRGDRS